MYTAKKLKRIQCFWQTTYDISRANSSTCRLLLTLTGLATFKSQVEHLLAASDGRGWLPVFAASTFWPPCALQLLLHCFSDLDARPPARHPPAASASFLSRLFFFWFDSVVWSGFRKTLQQDQGSGAWESAAYRDNVVILLFICH